MNVYFYYGRRAWSSDLFSLTSGERRLSGRLLVGLGLDELKPSHHLPLLRVRVCNPL